MIHDIAVEQYLLLDSFGLSQHKFLGYHAVEQCGTLAILQWSLRLLKNLSCCASQTGGSKGYAFIEFALKEVANIACQTMNGYIMFGRTLKCRTLTRKDIDRSETR